MCALSILPLLLCFELGHESVSFLCLFRSCSA
jgi:hypothetical protein